MDVKTLKQIEKYTYHAYKKYLNRNHSIDHTLRVLKNAKLIIKFLKIEGQIDKNLLTACCLLHDILITKKGDNIIDSFYYYIFEKEIIKKNIGDIINNFALSEGDANILKTAIVNHPDSIPLGILNKENDYYSQILQDADSIDYVSEIRLKRFNKNRKYMSVFSNLYICTIRKNIKYFLNFPQLAESTTLFNR